MQFSFGCCHLCHYVPTLQPSREALLASVLSLQCYHFSASLDSWDAGGIDKEGGLSCACWISRLRTIKIKGALCTFMAAGMSMKAAEYCSTSQTLARPQDFLSWVEHSANNAKVMGLIPVQAIQLRVVLNDPCVFLPTQNVP